MHKRYIKDNLLLDKARNGDEKAFAELFQYYNKIIHYYIAKIIKNQFDAEDLTMITFEKAFSNLDKYAPTFGFGCWLLKIAKNTALDFLTYQKRRPNNFIEVNDSCFHRSEIRTPEEQFINKELGENIDKVIDHLQPNYQEVIKWRYYDDLDYKEITSKYGLDGNIARSYMFRAKRILKDVVL